MKWPMICQRGTTYYVRVYVPLALQPMFKRKEVWKSLRTSNLEKAKRAALAVTAELQRVFTNPPDPKAVARDYKARVLTDDLAWRTLHTPTDDEGEAEALALTDRLEALETDPQAIGKLLDAVLLDQGLNVTASQRPAFEAELLRAEVTTLKALLARADGRDVEVEITVSELLEAYLRERGLGSKTEAEVRAAYRRFSDVVGADKNSPHVSKVDVRAYRENLFSTKLAPRTMKKAIGMVSTVFRFGVGQGLIPVNPFDGGLTKVSRQSTQTERRLPYTAAQIQTLLTASGKLTGARKWLPWLAAYSGARLEELGGLRVQDIRDGCLTITATEERRLKNPGSARQIPLHPVLIQRGFLTSLPKDGRIFPELTPDVHGVLTSKFSKWFARFSDDCGITDKHVTFHSFRHSFADALRRARVEPEIRQALLGHSTSTITARYGSGHDLKALREAVNAITYEGAPLIS